MKASIAAKLNVFKTNIYGTCPGGFCDYIQAYSEVLVVILCLDGFIFFVTLLPPLFNWSTKKSDGRKRIYFAALACFTFYFWLAFLLINSIYCFGFLAHLGPCNATQNQQASATLTPSRTPTSNGGTPSLTTTSMPTFPTLPESSLERPASTQSAPKLLASTSMATRFSSLVTSMEPSRPSSRSSSSWASRDPTSAFTFSPSSFTRVEPDKGSSSVSSFSSSVSGSPTSSSSFSSSSSSSNVGVNSEAGLSMSEMASSTRIVVLDDLHGALTTGAEAAAASVASTEAQEVLKQQQPQAGVPMALISWTSSDKANSSCVQLANEHETQLKNLTLVNVLILVVLFIVFIANAKEAMSAKALFHKETLCKREEVQRFLSSLVLKPPEVGHLINCFHTAKTNTDTRNKKANMAAAAANLGKKDGKDAGPPRKVVTFSAIENFTYQTWRDFSDVRLIEPSGTYPIIEIEVMLNFFPGDHYTAERYKAFVNQMTKTHSGKDQRITIDDYFHVEDHREWTFFIGKESHITPWWDKDAAKIPLSCIFFLGWPFRLAYGGRIAKHKVEVKKAVFVENNSADEGVSLSATPGSDDNANANTNNGERKPSVVVEVEKDSGEGNEVDEAIDEDDETQAMLETSKNNAAAPAVISTASSSNHEQFTEHRVNAVVSQPPKEAYPMASTTVATVSASAAAASGAASDHHYFYQQMQMGPSVPTTRKTPQQQQQQMPAFGHPLANVMPLQTQPPVAAAAAALQQQPPPAPQRRTAPLRTLREKDVVVTHQDINGVNTVALKDIDVQMTAMSGYETYV